LTIGELPSSSTTSGRASRSREALTWRFAVTRSAAMSGGAVLVFATICGDMVRLVELRTLLQW
jgi:hypothetical protein